MKRKLKMLTALLLALSMCLSQPAQIVLATDSMSVDVTADDSEIASEGESEESAEAEEIEEETDEEALVDDSADVLVGENIADIQTEELEDTGVAEEIVNDEVIEAEISVASEGDSEISDDLIASGVDGDLTWRITSDGLLTISGVGNYVDRAWLDYADDITSAIVNVSGINDTSYMFSGCKNLIDLNVDNLDTSNVTDMNHMFYHCYSIINLDLNSFDTSNVTSMSYMFAYCESLTSLDVTGFDTSSATNISYMFSYCKSLTDLDVTRFDTSNVKYMDAMFEYCYDLTNLDVSGFNTSEVVTMNSMFVECGSLTILDVSGFNTSNVKNMSSMFYKCSSLATLDVSNFDTTNVTGMGGMFYGCSSLTSLDLSNFDTSNVISMDGMFYGCSSLTSLDVSNFNTSNVTSMGMMFYKCSSLITLDLSNFDTSNVTYMSTMFRYCSALENVDVSSFNTEKVTSIEYMFADCTSLVNLDLSNFDTSSMETNKINLIIRQYQRYIFYNCSSLVSINLGSEFSILGTYSFQGCDSLESVYFEGDAPTFGKQVFKDVTATVYYPANNSTWDIYPSGLYIQPGYSDGYDVIGGRITWVAYDPDADEEDDETSGTCGDNLTWKVSDGKLTISGTGKMTDYSLESPAPWSEYTFVWIEIGEGVENIGNYAFYGKNVQVFDIAESVTTIGNHAFEKCDMYVFYIPDSITSIGISAFASCENLTSIAIPASVSIIWTGAFENCSALTQVGFQGNAPQMSIGVFTNDTLTAYYNASDTTWTEEVKNDYGGNVTWSDCITITKQPEDVRVLAWILGGDYVTFSLEAEGFDLTYAWYYKKSGEDEWTKWDSSAATASTPEITELIDNTMNEAKVYCLISDGVGNEIASTEITILVENVDYTWIFGEDNFSFINWSLAFGSGKIYIEDEMLAEYLDTLENTELDRTAMSFGEQEDSTLNLSESEILDIRKTNLINNNLVDWGGSCYGMSLLSLLIKRGDITAKELGASTTYELGPLTFLSNSHLESVINIYHISQKKYGSQPMCAVGKEYFAEWMGYLWDIAYDGFAFVMYLDGSGGAHSVVCYGAEQGDYTKIVRNELSWGEDEYCYKRLLIYNPNLTSYDYIYISSDFEKAELASDSTYDTFGMNLNDMSAYEYLAKYLDIPHYVYLDVDSHNSAGFYITMSDGTYALISENGEIVEATLDAYVGFDVNTLADGTEGENRIYTVYLPDDSEYYEITPLNGDSIEALLTFDDFSVTVCGTFELATIYADGNVDIESAKGKLTVNITLNNSEFDYITVKGMADGDVHFQITDDDVIITGDLSDYTVVNMDNDCNYTAVYVEGDTDVQATMENEVVTLYTDADGDEVYESLLPHAHYYIYEDNGDGTHTGTCIGGDDTYTEAHTYVNGVCEYCGAEEPSTVVSSGTCGENLNWTLDEDGTLTISGTGDMEERDSTTQNWAEYVASITSVIIEDGVTTIGAYAFCDCDSLESITIPDSVVSIGENAFYSCDSLTDVYYAGSESSWEQILIATGNDSLTAAEIHYGSSDETENPGEDSGETGEDSETSGEDSGTTGGDSGDDSGSTSGSGSADTESSDGSSDTGASTESSGGSDTDSTSSEASSVTDSTAVEGTATDGSAGTISAEETASESGNVTAAESVQTGDEGMPFALLAVLFLSGAAISALAVKRRRYGTY